MKRTLKQQILSKRNHLSKEETNKKSILIKNNLYSLPEFKKAKNILFYVSFNSEVDTREIIRELIIRKEKKVIVPYVEKNNPVLQLSELKNFNELEPKTFGILEPKSSFIREFNPNKLDLIIIPGAVFGLNGHRIGYGHGYYDRFLKTLENSKGIFGVQKIFKKFSRKVKNNIKKIGLAYDFQVVDKIPEEQHDVPMDIIITDKEIMHCKK